MSFIIFTKQNCPNCVTAKQLLKAKGFDYVEHDIEKDALALATLLEAHPQARQMPQIFYKHERIGGLAGLQAWLKWREDQR